jgi:hypothetical protein
VVIQEIWGRVAEDFSPFDVDVTTIEPSNFSPGQFQSVRVVVGGDQVDIGSQLRNREVRGAASFSGHTGLIAQVFGNTVQGPRSRAQTASHEAGHIFGSWLDYTYGLGHHTSTVPLPSRTRIMGTHIVARDIWWKEQTVLAADTANNPIYGVQEDVAVLLAALGARSSDHAGAPQGGTPLLRTSSGSEVVLEGGGIITMNAASLPRTCTPWSDASCSRVRDESAVSDEKDFFLFRADPGRLVASVYPISHEDSSDTPANLDAKIELWRQRSDGTWTSMATQGNGHSASDLFARLSYNVPTNEAGVYAVAAKSQGGYGDLGEYTVEVRGEDVREYTLNARLNLPEGPFVTAVPKTVRPGETVTLHGGGFATASSLLFSPLARASVVQFNGIGVPTSVRSSTELTFEVPVDGFCGEHYIRVVNPPRLTLLASEGDKLAR